MRRPPRKEHAFQAFTEDFQSLPGKIQGPASRICRIPLKELRRGSGPVPGNGHVELGDLQGSLLVGALPDGQAQDLRLRGQKWRKR